MTSKQIIDDRYELLEKIGEGGFGSVYKARDLRLNHFVAVKLLSLVDEQHEELIKNRFKEEAQISAKLHHENILKTYDFGEMHNQRLFLVSELLIGQSLAHELKKGPLKIQRTIRLMKQLCFGLSEAHEHGVVHRDLKPANIFLNQKEIKSQARVHETLKIIDFGIAKVMGHSSKTKTGLIFGSPPYMSPEQIFRPKEVSSKSDMYSVGVIFFRCLAGRLPFNPDPDAPMEIFSQHREGIVPLIRTFNPHFDDVFLQNLIFKLLAKLPEERPSAAEVFMLLEDYKRFETNPQIHTLSPPSQAAPPLNLFIDAPQRELHSSNLDQSFLTELDKEDSTSISPPPLVMNLSDVGPLFNAENVSAKTYQKGRSTSLYVLLLCGGLIGVICLIVMMNHSSHSSQEMKHQQISQSLQTHESVVSNTALGNTQQVAPQQDQKLTEENLTEENLIEETLKLPSQNVISPSSEQEITHQKISISPSNQTIKHDSEHRIKQRRTQQEAKKRQAQQEAKKRQAQQEAERKRRAQQEAKKRQAQQEAERKRRAAADVNTLKLSLPKKSNYAPGSVIPLTIQVKDQAGSRISTSQYKLTRKLVDPKIGEVRGRSLYLYADTQNRTKATLTICAQHTSIQSKTVCDHQTIYVYKPTY